MQETLRQFKAGIFQALAHPTRIAVLEQLKGGELSVSQLCERLALEQANVSQHLAVLRHRSIVLARKEGNQVYYSLRDPILGQVLDLMRDYFHKHLQEAMAMLREDQKETVSVHRRKEAPR